MPSLAPFPGRGIPPYGLGMRPARTPLGRVRDAVLWPLVERHFGKAMLPGCNALRAEAGLAPLASPLELYRAPSRVLVMTGPPLEYPRDAVPANVCFVGFQPWDAPGSAPEYLAEPGDPWVLVTCSSDYQGDEELARVAVEALADEPVRVLVTLGHAEGVPELPTARNVRVEQFVSHGHVLPRAAAVVCHGGMGIVAKSVAAGVPLVCVPFGRDQPEIARRVAESGAGVVVKQKQLRADRLRTAVRRARGLSSEADRAARVMAEHSGPGPLATAVEELVPNGHPVG